MPRARKPSPPTAERRPASPEPTTPAASGSDAGARRETYHHGSLREALIAATLALLEEGGPERVTVREAATRAGVSSGAPFRHFPTRTALLTAVAEQAMGRFRAEIATAVEQAPPDDPLARFRAVGTAYLRWALRNPTHFRLISDRSLIDFEGSESLRRDNREIRALMDELLTDAERRGLLRAVDVTLVPVAARALVYGLARMHADGHLAQWDVRPEEAERQLQAALDLVIGSLSAPPPERPAAPRPDLRST